MSQKPDDLDAVRAIVDALKPFDEIERERILRWAGEKLGLKNFTLPMREIPPPSANQTGAVPVLPVGSKDIKSFLTEKKPSSENQLVAAVAYYYKFEAPLSERKSGITKEDLMDACRKANWKRPKFPNQVLVNATSYGLVDKIGTGTYEINAVGENLVAVSMPGTGTSKPASKKGKLRTKKSAKK